MRILSTAPGKLVLLGEYAVLHGHPALVMAVDRRAAVEVLNRDGGPSSVDAPEVEAIGMGFSLGADGTVDWESNDRGAIRRLGLFSLVLRALAKEIDYPRLGPFAVMLSTSDFFAGEQSASKLGLGSSAALTVALASALMRLAGQEQLLKKPANIWLTRLLEIHASFQGGLGSGLDIAAALRGGLLEYRKAPGSANPEADKLELPPGLEFLCVWSGRSAVTPKYLSRLAAWRRDNGSEFERHMSAMGRISREGINAVRAGNGARFCEAVGAYGGALAGFGEASGLDILSEEHLRIRSIADSLGVAYKPCGAGGGDVGAAFATDPDKVRSLKTRLTEIGFGTVSLGLDPSGLRVRVL